MFVVRAENFTTLAGIVHDNIIETQYEVNDHSWLAYLSYKTDWVEFTFNVSRIIYLIVFNEELSHEDFQFDKPVIDDDPFVPSGGPTVRSQ